MCGGQGKEGLGIGMRTLKREVLFLCVFDFNVKNEAIENVDFNIFFRGACPSLAGCKQLATVRVYPPRLKIYRVVHSVHECVRAML